MMTQFVDEQDWLLGFVPPLIRAIAAHVQQLDVIALGAQPTAFPDNVRIHSLGKERGASRVQRFQQLRKTLAKLLPQTDIFFSHLSDSYPLAVAPFALPQRVPMTMWYTHKQVTPRLKLSERLVQRIYTASPESLTLETSKARVIGHGIDMDLFQPSADSREEQRIVAVGRITPIKNLQLLVAALAQLPTATLTLIGAPATEADKQYQADLKAQAETLGVADRITWLGGLRQAALLPHLQTAHVAANLCPTGGMDKVVLEALACGVPTVVHNKTFINILGGSTPLLLVKDATADAVAARLAAVFDAPAAAWEQPILNVRDQFSLDALAKRLTTDFAEVIASA